MSDILDIIRGKQPEPLFGTTKPRQEYSTPMKAGEFIGTTKPRVDNAVPMTADEMFGTTQPRAESGAPLTGQELVGDDPTKFNAAGSEDAELEEAELLQIQELQRAALEQKQSVVARVNKAIGDFTRSAIQGGTLGFSDEIAGIVSEYAGNRDFNEALSLERARLDAVDPATRFLGELTGGVITGIGTGGLISPASQGLARLAKFAALGATEGTIAGFGHAEGDIFARGSGAAQGGAVGAVAGAAAPVVADKVVALARTIMGHPATTGAQKAAIEKLAKAMKRDEITPERALAKLQQLGPHATVADLPGANVQGVARAAAGTPGPSRQLAERTLNTRAVGAANRVEDAVKAATSDESMFAARNQLIAGQARMAKPLYEEALSAGDLQSPALTRLLEKSEDVQAALRQARRLPEFADLADNNIILLDKAYKNIGGKYSAAVRAGDKELARDLNTLRVDLRKAIVDQVPKYGEALDAFSSQADLVDAMDLGRVFIKEDTDVLADTVKAMTSAEKQQFAIGVSRAIRERLDVASDSVSTARRIFGNKAIREKLQIAMPGKFREFQKTMLQEAVFSKTTQKVLGGSPTAPRQAEMADLAREAAFASRGSPSGLLFAAADLLRGSRTPSKELGQTMFTPGAGTKVFNQVQEQQMQRRLARPLAGAMTGAAVTGGAQVGR